MGQDIHAFVEYEHKHGWNQWARVRLARWYDLFAFMATGGDTRRPDIKPVFAPRGVPEGMDIFTETAHDKDERETGIHHASWLTLAELETVRRTYLLWFEQEQPLDKRPELEDFETLLIAMGCFEGMGYSTRLVFWFDN